MRAKRFFLKTLYFFAILLVFFAILINAARIFLPKLDKGAHYLEGWASSVVGQPVKIQKVKAEWRDFFEPEISFTGVEFLSSDRKHVLLHVDHLAIGIDIVHSLLNKGLYPSNFILDGLDVSVKHAKGEGFSIKGLSLKGDNASGSGFLKRKLVYWLAAKSNILFRNVRLHFYENGRKSFSIDRGQFEVRNNTLNHSLLGRVFVDNKEKTTLNFVVNFNEFGDFQKDISADAYFNVKNFPADFFDKSSVFRDYFSQVDLRSGLVSFRSWAKIRSGRLVGVKAEVVTDNAGLYLKKFNRLVDFKKASGNFFWSKKDNGWQFSANDIDLRWGDGRWLERQLAVDTEKNNENNSVSQSIFVKKGSLQALQELAKHFGALPSEIKNKIADLQLKGDFENLRFSRILRGDGGADYVFKTKFDNLSLHDKKHSLSFSNLSGNVYYSPGSGYFYTKNSRPSFVYSKIFDHKFDLDNMSGLLSWKKKHAGYDLNANNFLVTDKYFGLLANGHVWLPTKGGPVVDLLAGFYLKDLTKIKYYLPTPVMNKSLDAWFTKAFYSGEMKQSTLLLRGGIDKFPFKHHDGRFEILSHLQNLDLLYAEKWPLVKNTQAFLTLNESGLNIKLHSGKVSGVQVLDVDGDIPDLISSDLFVKGKFQGDLSDAHVFVNNSPMALKQQLAGMKLSGPIAMSLNSDIPLHSDTRAITVKGALTFDKSAIQMPSWGVYLSDVVGNLGFTNGEVFSKKIMAKSFGYPVTTEVATRFNNKKEREVRIHFKSSIDMARLYKTYSFPILHFAKGVAGYNGMLLLHDSGDPLGNILTISSGLKGVSFDIPKPYAKNSSSKKTFLMSMHAGGSGKFPLYFRINYGKEINVISAFMKKEGKYEFWGGKLLFGSDQVSLPKTKDWSVSGVVDNLDWPVWQKFLAKLSGIQKEAVESGKGAFNDIRLKIKRLSIFNRKINNASINIKPYGVGGYDVGVSSKVIAGKIKIPKDYKVSPVLIDLDYLYYNPSSKKLSYDSLQPGDFFPVNFSVKQFFYKSNPIGSVDFQLTNSKDRLHITKALIASNNYKISFDGDWLSREKKMASSVVGNLSANDLGGFLNKFDLSSAIAKGAGVVDFSLSWPGSIFKPEAKALNGGFSLNFSDGRIVNLNNKTESELGLGKLLGLFSVRSISEKLLLNFGSLVNAGFPFSKMEGDFRIVNGLAKTQNFSLDGSIADVLAAGSLNFPNKTYDIAMTVRPYLTSSLPVIAAVAGTPIIGAAVWVVNKVVLAPLTGRMAESKYRLKGSWAKPEVLDLPKPR